MGAPAPDTTRLGAYQRRYHLALPPEVVLTCLLEDREGNAWLGTAGQGLWQHADRYLSLWPKAGGPPSISNTAEVKLARSAALGGGFWVGAAAAGVYTTAPAGQEIQPVAGLPASLGSAVTALAYAPGSGLWVGTAADGIYLLPTPKNNTFTRAAQHFTTANGLLHNSIYALLADRSGRVWVGAHNTGLAVWEPATRRFRYEKLTPVGLDASALAEDAAGTIWVGTEGQGLFFQPPSRGWQHLDKATGTLPDDYLTALLPLPAPLAGSLLLVHPQGLTLLDPRHRPTPLAAPDDQLVRGLLPAATLVTRPRPLAWLSISTDALRLDLRQLALARPGAAPTPRLALSGAEVDGEARPATSLGELPAGQHRISFGLQGINLAPSGALGLQYRYRLRGLADHWSRPSPAGEAQFVGLGPGRYVLEAQVRRATLGAAWTPAATSVFTIATPWWRTPAALVLALLALAGLLAMPQKHRAEPRRSFWPT